MDQGPLVGPSLHACCINEEAYLGSAIEKGSNTIRPKVLFLETFSKTIFPEELGHKGSFNHEVQSFRKLSDLYERRAD